MSIHAQAGRTLRLVTPVTLNRLVMPRAAVEGRGEWTSDKQAWRYLRWRGWTERKSVLIPPAYRPAKISAKEWRAAQYLVDEGDWSCAPVME